jgi:hypothetical protein
MRTLNKEMLPYPQKGAATEYVQLKLDLSRRRFPDADLSPDLSRDRPLSNTAEVNIGGQQCH